ncbi:DALR anticodon-binding domain-containing protein 3 [Aricia agestis]|uniref:DALR anticodon-binding domain-containing protein 3 n=1 Tax=Aricia agestis TaxID=91739 RepID=UPI001C20704D|nr:DALR anticodon-binding domain-containing protein 3 [Aricia agestis]
MMLNDDISEFITNLYLYLINKRDVNALLVKKHTSNFKTHGDLSFVNTVKSWQEYLNVRHTEQNNFLKYLNKTTGDIVENSQSWKIIITKCTEINDRVYMHLNRPIAIYIGLKSAINNNLQLASLITTNDKCKVSLDSKCLDTSVTSLRAKYLTSVVENLCCIFSIDQELMVTTKSGSNSNDVFVGTVLNAKTCSKETAISADEFIRIRQNELTLIAQHKYGVRVSTDNKWSEFIAHLGESAVAFELLQTKASSPVKILFDAPGGCSKGASFILYNCARLETLMRTFNEKVEEGSYPSLPSAEQIDFTLLSNEDEWCLIFNYVMGLPSVIKCCTDVKDNKVEFRPHLICNYLSGMVKIFSQYYRRVRILTEHRKHLLPVMYARIHMIKVLNGTLKTCLKLLNIKSVSQM